MHETPRLRTLTALRFPAAFALLIAHVGGMSESESLRSATHQGAVGVSFFFILSGFLLSWADSGGRGALTFYRNRFARIYPLHALTWLLVVVLGLVGAMDAGGHSAQGTALVLVQAWFPDLGTVFAANGVSWSLSCEAFFYALFPLVAILSARRSARVQWAVIAVCAMMTTAIIPWLTPIEFWPYIFPPARFPEFVLGVCLAYRFRAGWRSPIGLPLAAALLAMAVVVSFFVAATFASVAVTAVPIAIFISAVATWELNGGRGVLTSEWLRKLGIWSFALYLIHNIVVSVVLTVTGRLTLGALVPVGFAVAAVSVGLSFLAYRYIESPAERRLRGPGRQPVSLSG